MKTKIIDDANTVLLGLNLIDLNIEYSDFLKTIPVNYGNSAQEANDFYELKFKKWCVKMSLKYEVPHERIKNHYEKI